MCTSILFMYTGLMLLGLFYFLVYIGAVAVLFLFSVMILDLKIAVVERDLSNFFNIFLLCTMFIVQFGLYFILVQNFYSTSMLEFSISTIEALKLLGYIIYGDYLISFLANGMILLFAMMGAIFLTNHQKGFFKRNQYSQLFRNRFMYNVSIY